MFDGGGRWWAACGPTRLTQGCRRTAAWRCATFAAAAPAPAGQACPSTPFEYSKGGGACVPLDGPQLLHHMPTAAITIARRQGVARARLLRILVGRALLILRFFLTSSTVPDERRIVQADVEPNNEANRRLYENFVCRTEGGAYGSSFEQCTPSIKRRGWLGYRFAAAPTRIRSLPCRPRLCGDQK